MSFLEQDDFEDDWDDLTPSFQDRLFENLQQLESEHIQRTEIDGSKNLWTEELTTDPLEDNDESSDVFEDFLDQLLQIPFKARTFTASAVEKKQQHAVGGTVTSSKGRMQYQQSMSTNSIDEVTSRHTKDENEGTPFSIEANTVMPPQPPAPQMLMGFRTASGKSILKEVQQKALEQYKATEKLKATNALNDVKGELVEEHTLGENDNLKRTTSFKDSTGNSQQSAYVERNNKRPAEELPENTYSMSNGVLERYGGFTTGNGKRDWAVTAAAKRRAISLLGTETANTDTKTEETYEEPRITLSSAISDTALPSLHINDLKNTPSFRTPLVSMNRTSKEDKAMPTLPAQTYSKIPKQKAFKSPIVAKERTKAALRGKSTQRLKGAKVFDLTIPNNRDTIANLGKPLLYTREQLFAKNVPSVIINMTLHAAKSYKFNGHWGFENAAVDMKKAGALFDRISSVWVENHYAMIVWKNACLIRSYPDRLLERWTFQYVLDQLLYRYEREVNMGHRSVLRKIFEQDDTPDKHMVLCITDIIKRVGNSSFKSASKNQERLSSDYILKVSDGWYEVPACCDKRMERAILKGKLKIGHKLSVTGAQIVGAKKAQSPLEISDNETLLMITANSCLPARFDAKLGYQRQKLIIRSISSIFEDGGLVAAIDVIICRKFPLLYTEWLPNDIAITRTAKEEEDIQNEINEHRFYRNNSSVSFPYFSAGKRAGTLPCLDRSRSEPQSLENRRVTGSFRVRICDSKSSPGQELATLSIYGANELQHLDIVEGSRYKIYFVQPNSKNKKYSGLDLKTLSITRWEPMPAISQPNAYLPRYLTFCGEIQRQTLHSSVDLVVAVLHVSSTELETVHGRRLWRQKAFVTDESQGICHVTLYVPEKSFADINGQIIALINARYEAYDSKFRIANVRTTDDTEILTKLTSASDYIKKGCTSLINWRNSKPDEIKSITSRINELI